MSTAASSLPAPPPSLQEIQRKLSVHSVAKSKSQSGTPTPVPQPPPSAPAPAPSPSPAPLSVSGTESDSDSIISPDVYSPAGGQFVPQQPLSAIAERRSVSGGEDSEDEDDADGAGGWRTASEASAPRGPLGEGTTILKAGYLWKKGERRKTWKKRWFVLRPAHVAYYKSSAEYQLLRLLELGDVHSCTKVSLKRHENTFGLVSPVRTFYLQAATPGEVDGWVVAIESARQALVQSGELSGPTPPMAIPGATTPRPAAPVTPSPPFHQATITSSDSEDASPHRTYSMSSQTRPTLSTSPGKSAGVQAPPVKEAGKTLCSGYLMKCTSKRRAWRKRWFVLTAEKLIYTGSHMDAKAHRQFPFAEILDALEYDVPSHRHKDPSHATSPPPAEAVPEEAADAHTFKIVTTKRTLLVCAPSEEDEIKWLGAIRALVHRRTESGVVPGQSAKGAEGATGVGASAATPGGPGGSSGVRGKIRRLSQSGSSAPGGLPMAGEAAKENQS
ncbi:hypothetical protein BD626DRAFT_491338 [Schizophyllum amplum]|uniref:PH domain-containing protein n=1 Tax=Schizophyllum amplum TaxID=97359 RepID=A0A550CHL1_9AGAR|nr:hypothetical protein BD626DRAFT_491338 [Auriculariopsis ampla]